ncbi:hypothetical protein [Foetidibacter luteolus]|uniref:hypothetical protein n=1 Tax=Foetidibacter luteolus TaxID=2608880 RepID=UPI00129BEA71|nr:hypothetical protein [Foetidibacter luteolus]
MSKSLKNTHIKRHTLLYSSALAARIKYAAMLVIVHVWHATIIGIKSINKW